MARISLADWAAVLERQIAAIKPTVEGALAESVPIVEALAKAKLGEYQPAVAGFGYSFPAWSDLAESTLADKERQGDPTPSPLLRQDQLRESIHAEAEGWILRVGTNDPIAKFQEYGTSRMPPRPFIGPALIEVVPLVGKMLAAAMMRIFGGR
jgi:phage gpG-like protein